MRDNISIIIAAVLSAILVIILPLISILERQDNMTYNVALTLTNEFVNEVRNKGFIDKASYEKYLEKMSKTGALYDYQFQAYKTIIIKDIDEPNKFIEEKMLYNQKDIEDAFTKVDDENHNKTGVFTLEVGDEFYIKVKNTNISSAALMYRFISGVTNKNIVNISCGGRVNNFDADLYNAIVNDVTLPKITISIPDKISASGATTPIKIDKEEQSEEYDNGATIESVIEDIKYKYSFKISNIENDGIVFKIELENFAKFLDPNAIENGWRESSKKLQAVYLKDYILLNNFTADIYIYKSSRNLDNTDYINTDYISINNTGEASFYIGLQNIKTESIKEEISITIKPELGVNSEGYSSAAKDSVIFMIENDYNVHDVKIKGPYLEDGYLTGVNLGDLVNNYDVHVDNDPTIEDEISQNIYFLIDYTSIWKPIDLIVSDLSEKLRISYDTINMTLKDAEEQGYVSDIVYSNERYSDIYFYGTIKVSFKYIRHLSGDDNQLTNYNTKKNKIYLEDGWTNDAYSYGSLYNSNIVGVPPGSAKAAESKTYRVLKDTKAPTADPIKVTSENKYGEWKQYKSGDIFLVGDKEIRIALLKDDNTTSVIDRNDTVAPLIGPGSGIRKIGISNNGTDYEWLDWVDTRKRTTFVNWTLDVNPGETKKIYVKLMDYTENISSAYELEIKYVDPSIAIEIIAKDKITSEIVPPNIWHNGSLIVTARINELLDATNYILTMGDKTVESPLDISEEITTTGEYEFIATAEVDSPFSDVSAVATAIYKIDKNVPTIKLPEIDTTRWLKAQDINDKEILFNDEHSGMDKVQAYLSEEEIEDPSKYVDISSVLVNKEKISLTSIESPSALGENSLSGEHYLHIKAIDAVGNEKVASQKLKIDKKGPTITYKTDDMYIYITIEDYQSGINKESIIYAEADTITETIQDEKKKKPTAYTLDTTEKVSFKLSRDTEHKYTYIYVEDNVGNISEDRFETIENPVTRVTKADGARISTRTGAQATDLNNAFNFTFGNIGEIEYTITNISIMSEVYCIATTDNTINIDNASAYISDEFLIDSDIDGNQYDMNRKFNFTVKSNGTDFTRYINIVVKMRSGQFKVHTIKVTNVNEPRIISVYADPRVKYDKWDAWILGYISGQDWNGYRTVNSSLINNTISIYNDSHNPVYNYQGTTKIRLKKVKISNLNKQKVIIQYWRDRAILEDYWENIATLNNPTSEIIEISFDEQEFDAGQRIRVITVDSNENVLTEDMITLN